MNFNEAGLGQGSLANLEKFTCLFYRSVIGFSWLSQLLNIAPLCHTLTLQGLEAGAGGGGEPKRELKVGQP